MRAIIVAASDLANLPAEVQSVANTLSSAGWTVRLCIGPDASRAGLLAAAGEGDCNLAWFGLHSGPMGFELHDGIWPPSQLGTWLRNVSAHDCVLNSCFSMEHVDTIQRAADGVAVACTIDPNGVDDELAWQVGVYLVRSYVISGDLQSAVQQASGMGSLAYRYISQGGVRIGEGRRRMPADEIREQLQLLVQAVQGDMRTGTAGLLTRVSEISTRLDAIEHQISEMQRRQTTTVSPTAAGMIAGSLGMVAVLLFMVLLRLGGGL
jgi:hypothetical protein